MKLNKKISLTTTGVLLLTLLTSSALNVYEYRNNYKAALLTASHGLGFGLNNLVRELLSLGLPIESLDGMDRKLDQLIEDNPHIKYVGIMDDHGKVLYHSDETLIGKQFDDSYTLNSLVASQPLTQFYHRFDGLDYYDLNIPVFDQDQLRIGSIRLGFLSNVVDQKIMQTIQTAVLNFVVSFLFIVLVLNQLLGRLVSRPIAMLSEHARLISQGQYEVKAPLSGKNDELGILADAFNRLSATIQAQIQALQNANNHLEEQVQQRTRELQSSVLKFRKLFQSSSDAVILLTENKIFDCNPATLKMFQCQSIDHICGLNPAQLFVSATTSTSNTPFSIQQHLIQATKNSGHRFECLLQRFDGNEEFFAEVVLSPVDLDGQLFFQAVVRNINSQKLEVVQDRQQKRVLEELFSGHNLKSILTSIISELERETRTVFSQLIVFKEAENGIECTLHSSSATQILTDQDFNQIYEQFFSAPSAHFTVDQLSVFQKKIQNSLKPDQKNHEFKIQIEPIWGSNLKMLGLWIYSHIRPRKLNHYERTLIEHSLFMASIAIEKSRSESHKKLAASVFDNSYEGIMITDPNNCIVDVNPAFTRITGFEKQEVLGRSPKVLQSGKHHQAFYDQMWQSLTDKGYWSGEIWNRRKTGEIYAEMLAIARIQDDEQQVNNYVAVFSDISRIKAHEAELNRIAHYDPLTDLPNRRLLGDRLSQALAHASRNQSKLAICYLYLDGFKPVNDNYGHDAGDQLLQEVARRLRSCLRAEDTLARLGGDEFILLIGDLDDVNECYRLLNRALSVISAPLFLKNSEVNISASIGVTLYPDDDADGDTLLRHADHAMYKAKQEGKNCYFMFDFDYNNQLKESHDRLLNALRGLQKNEFVLHFQPKVDLLDGRLVGTEALIRWQQTEKELLYPNQFLHDFQTVQAEIQLGEWVIQAALRQIENWQKSGLGLTISINISASHLLSEYFIANLDTLLKTYPHINPAQIEFEILETAAMDDMSRAIQIIEDCKRMGISFSLDDFGTGYSSLSYFRRLPVDILKIDQEFVRDMLVDHEDFTIVESVIRLAHAFNRTVIAEGIETHEHAAQLIQIGCRLGQGYGIARPMPAEHLIDWLTDWNTQATWKKFNAPE